MATLTLTLACGDYDRTLGLRTGAVRVTGVELRVLVLEPEEMFYRMARLRDFDVAEFSLSTYTVLRGRGEPLVAIPRFFPPSPSVTRRSSCGTTRASENRATSSASAWACRSTT